MNDSKNNITNISSIKNKSYKSNLKKESNSIEEESNNSKDNSKDLLKNSNNSSGILKQKKINYNKYVNNRKKSKLNDNNNRNKNSNLKKYKKDFEPIYKGPILTAMSTIINKKKSENENENERNSSSVSSNSNPKGKDTHNYSPNNSFNLLPELNTDYEEIGKNINSAFDEELKQLEIDEENIKRLLEQLGNGKFNDMNSMKNTDEKIIN